MVSYAYLYKMSELFFIMLCAYIGGRRAVLGPGIRQSDDHTYLEHDSREQFERRLLKPCNYAAVLRRAVPIWQEWMTLIPKPSSTAGVGPLERIALDLE